MTQNQQKSTFKFSQTIMDIIIGIFCIVDEKHATSYVNGVYTSLIRVTLALALDIGLGSLV